MDSQELNNPSTDSKLNNNDQQKSAFTPTQPKFNGLTPPKLIIDNNTTVTGNIDSTTGSNVEITEGAGNINLQSKGLINVNYDQETNQYSLFGTYRDRADAIREETIPPIGEYHDSRED